MFGYNYCDKLYCINRIGVRHFTWSQKLGTFSAQKNKMLNLKASRVDHKMMTSMTLGSTNYLYTYKGSLYHFQATEHIFFNSTIILVL